MDKCCGNCDWNDDGLCDRVGLFVEDDDQCQKWHNHKQVSIPNNSKGLNKCGHLSYQN